MARLTRFIDEATIKLISGHGGPGAVSFRRETFIPRGGPDGGDGGKGGDIYLISTHRVRNLKDMRFRREYRAMNGMYGAGAHKTGRSGEDTLIYVPVGTIVTDSTTQEILFDFTDENMKYLAATGGRGGKGNAHFVTSVHQTPRFAQPGEPGQEVILFLELKLLADIGIIGFPNAGKSTLISKLTQAQPKIGDYAFTTRTPNIGVMRTGDHYQCFVLADIPGLIQGASQGLGLGTRFLRHIQRTKALIHMLDGMTIVDALTQPYQRLSAKKIAYQLYDQYSAVRKECEQFDQRLLTLPEIVVLNKIDAAEDPDIIQEILITLEQKIEKPIFAISARYEQGLTSLTEHIYDLLTTTLPQEKIYNPDDYRLRGYSS